MGNAISKVPAPTALQINLPSAATLLSRMRRTGVRLTDPEIDIIVQSLDTEDAETIRREDSYEDYISAELHIGEEREFPPMCGVGEHAALEQYDLDFQQQAFQLVKSDHRIEQRLRRSKAWIPILGVDLFFFPHQLYAAVWLLVHERGPRRGAILADKMGLGKTTTAYLYIILNYLLAYNLDHIRRHPLMHCPPSSPGHPQLKNARCPIAHFFGIECACQESSVAFQLGLTARNGVSLIFVPAGLIGVWESDFDKLGLSRHLGLRLFIQHRNFASRIIPRSQVHLLHSRDGCDDDTSANRFIVVTSIESYSEWVQQYCSNTYFKATNKPVCRAGLRWARILRDEAHLTPNGETRLYRIIADIVESSETPPNFLAVTGTPMLRSGVRDMLALVEVINQISPELRNDASFADFLRPSQLDSIADEFLAFQAQVNVNSEAPAPDSVINTVQRLLVAYCIRRHAHSFQNNKALVYVPPLVCYEVLCPLDTVDTHRLRHAEFMLKKDLSRALERQFEHWVAKGGAPSRFGVDPGLLLENVRMARVVASFPALARYGPPKKLTWNHIKSEGWHLKCEESIFYRDIVALEASSGKLQVLRRFITLWEPTQSYDNLPEQLLIISEFAPTCHIVECFLTHINIPCVWMHADINNKRRQELVDAFQDPLGHPHVRPFRVLIGTSRILGQGLTLNRAHRAILMEPSHHAAVEAQNADRIHRLGSQTDKCRFYRLVNPDSSIEQFLVESQNRQCDLQNGVEWMTTLSSSGPAAGTSRLDCRME